MDGPGGLFPVFEDGLPTLQEVREAVADVEEFHEATDEENGLVFFNYRFCHRGTFPMYSEATTERQRRHFQIRRECRGLCFSSDGAVVARRFHKFFNVGERPDTSDELLDLSRPHTVMVKMDGSLVSPILLRDGRVRWASKGGFTSITDAMESRFLCQPQNAKFVTWPVKWLREGWTPLFEWCSLRNKIVLEYPEDQLVMLGMRHNRDGRYMPYAKLREIALEGDIPLTDAYQGSFASPKEMLSKIKSQEAIEGFVILFEEDGAMYKVKTEWYFDRAHTKMKSEFALSNERGMWELILGQQLDDALPCMDPIMRASAQAFSDELFAALKTLHHNVLKICSDRIKLSKKDFVLFCKSDDSPVKQVPQPLLFAFFDALQKKEDTWEVTLSFAMKLVSTQKGLEVLREALGGQIRFREVPIVEKNIEEDN